MNKYLSEIQDRLKTVDSTGMLHRDTVRVLFDLFRQHIEENRLQHKYRVLMFYCNWSLHVSLDKGIVQDILDDISAVLADPNEKLHCDRISVILSVARLRAEIRHLLNNAGFTSIMFDSHPDWEKFLSFMSPALLNKPLVRTRPTSLTIYADKLDLHVPDLSLLDPKYVAACSVRDGAVFWRVFAMPKGVTISGPLSLTERPEDFSTLRP